MIKRILLTVLLSSITIASDNLVDEISVDWIHLEKTKQISAFHKLYWLEDNTAILYDLSIPKAQRNLLRLDPKNPKQLKPLIDKKKSFKKF
jgi:hypothetical protein